MQRLLQIILKISKGMHAMAAVALTFMILLTVADVILRSFRKPIIGTYELVALSGAVIIGFSIPFTSWVKGHVSVDFFILKLSQRGRKIFNLMTKGLGIGLFLVIGWNLLVLGRDLCKAGEVTPTRHIPFYPVLYGIGICCFFQSLVLFCDILKIFGREDG
jgi:TRAP-type C4-dicarboxylate transport system permease small subunit